jgi:competence protein ComEA
MLQDSITTTLQVYNDKVKELYQRYASKVKPYIGWICMLAIIVVAGTAFLLQPRNPQAPEVKGVSITSATASASSQTAQSAAKVKVDVSGAVNQPGVKELSVGDRVEDALRAADGLSGQADTDYVAMTINLAAKVQDGDKIFIPLKGQPSSATSQATTDSAPTTSAPKSTAPAGKISINRASISDLDTLPGVGATYAQRIVDNRPYSSVNELCTKSIFRSKSTCDKILPLVTL